MSRAVTELSQSITVYSSSATPNNNWEQSAPPTKCPSLPVGVFTEAGFFIGEPSYREHNTIQFQQIAPLTVNPAVKNIIVKVILHFIMKSLLLLCSLQLGSLLEALFVEIVLYTQLRCEGVRV